MKTKMALLWLALISTTACTTNGKLEYEQGLELNNKQQYSQAIAYFEQALIKSPDNSLYQQKLNEAKSQLADELSQQVNLLLSKTPKHIKNFNQAEQIVAEVKSLDINQAELLTERLSDEKHQFIEAVNRDYQAIHESMHQQKWLQAQGLLNQLIKRYPDYKNTTQLLAQLTKNGSQDYLNQAKQAFDQENFEKVVVLAESALALNPELTQAEDLKTKAKTHNGADYFIQQAELAEKNKKWHQAETYYLKALEFSPNNASIQNKLKRIETNKELTLISQSNRYLADGYLYKAFLGYLKTQQYSFEKNAIQRNALKVFLSVKITARADHFLVNKQSGSAIFWLKTLQQIAPDANGLRNKLSTAEKSIQARLNSQISARQYFDNAQAENKLFPQVEAYTNAQYQAQANQQPSLALKAKSAIKQIYTQYQFQ
ncbi:hypothetical protein [Catenovulum adriaticum]|uniref:Tetratricopeptide repeat protein n=1 Tax=Catenovulum adriaticum TaxID=2984846 RepID=A0ABY7AMM8_9ALTE|nr:hypothetical protein [Catenovulum sp. TS8]WAJ69987.1 hypothetical protein OLW01_12695 [Catenovulum sp. TS8]